VRIFRCFFLLAAFALSISSLKAQLYVANIDGTTTKEIDHVNYSLDSISANQAGDELLLAARKNNAGRVFLIATTGANLKQLTSDDAPDAFSPVFDSDQKRVVFTEFSSGIAQIYTADRSWTNKTLLVKNAGGAEFSHDGSRLVFTRAGANSTNLLFVAKADGTGEQQVPIPDKLATNVSFNPIDNQGLLFASIGTGIVSINSDGTARRTILQDNMAVEPRYTPDGKQIVYASSAAGANIKYELYVINSDGSNPKKLTNQPKNWCRHPVPSADGKSIFFIVVPTSKTAEFEKTIRTLGNLAKTN
jgi:Tol biopolymer transport system component